ncbi:CDP-diacylglycerol-inositol 3-phosphatidyltransferase [Irineochytrium annulatum]|nr:CDP-diacylglycerol-inositol 3-phosphatidyltransferase [Irineochytrium annulatum]
MHPTIFKTSISRSLAATKFGAVLDMVTDRSTTACLLVHLTTLHPQFALLYQFLISLDLSSHYFQMVSSLTVGNESHKQMEAKAHPLLRLYYMNKTVLFLVCALDQLFYITVYLLSWVSPETGELFLDGNGRTALWGLAVISGVFFVIKQVLNGIQLVGAAQVLARVDLQARLKGKEKVM